MEYANYDTMRITREAGVVRAVIDHPPINLFDMALITEMDRLGTELADDDDARVVVFSSANPDFFIAHADVALIRLLPRATTPEATPEPPGPTLFQQMVDRFRTIDTVSIGCIEGIARGGGSEFLLSLDMRFGAVGTCVLAQPEVALGIIPGGSGTQRLPRLCGRGRALEIVLGCGDFDAETAERYGWINRALPAGEIRAFVDDLARRIATFPPHAIAEAKRAAAAAEPDPIPGLVAEAWAFDRTLAYEETQRRMGGFLQNGGQTAAVERGDLAALFALLR